MTPVVFRPGGSKPWLNEEPPRRPDLGRLFMIFGGLLLTLFACAFIGGMVVASQQPPEPTVQPPTEVLLPTITETPTPSDTPIFTETPTDTAEFTLTPTETTTATITPSLTVTTTPPYQTFTPTPVQVTVMVTVMTGGGGGNSGAPVVITAPPVVITSPPIIVTLPVIITATIIPDSGLTGSKP